MSECGDGGEKKEEEENGKRREIYTHSQAVVMCRESECRH